MVENVASQITIGDVEKVSIIKNKVGRKAKVYPDSYLKAVYKCNSTNDQDIANEIGCDRSRVYRFRMNPNNNKVVEEAFNYVTSIMNLDKVDVNEFKDINKFMKVPIIDKWIDLMTRRDVQPQTQIGRIGALRNICLKLNIHPRLLDLDEVADLVIEMKKLHYNDIKQPCGLSYLYLREAVRDWFMTIHNVSGQYLNSLGVDKKAPNKSGVYAKQFVPKDVRYRLLEVLKKYAENRNEYLELVMIVKMMFYTASRIAGTIRYNFLVHDVNMNPDFWVLTIEDKGRGINRFKEKFFTHNALEDLKTYIRERFKIEPEEAKEKITYLFPSFVSSKGKLRKGKVSKILREALKEAGLSYDEFQPAHIFRHTFAQTFLRSSGWNYELCCIIGGWDSDKILRKHYGKMSSEAKVRAVKRSMGLEIPDNKEVVLQW